MTLPYYKQYCKAVGYNLTKKKQSYLAFSLLMLHYVDFHQSAIPPYTIYTIASNRSAVLTMINLIAQPGV